MKKPTPHPNLSCQEFVEVATDFLEQQLSAAEAQWTEEHLEQCDHCRAYLEQLRSTIEALHSLREPGLDAELRERILAAMR